MHIYTCVHARSIEDKDLREKRKEAEIDAQRQGAVMSGKSSKFRMNLPMYWHLNLRDLQQTGKVIHINM